MYKPQLIFGSLYGELEEWISAQPARFKQTRVKDRMEAVLKGELVETIVTSGNKRPNSYQYQIYITKDHPYLYDYMEFLEERGHKYGPQLRSLMLGEIVPRDYVPFKWKNGETKHESALTVNDSQRPQKTEQSIASLPTPSSELTQEHRSVASDSQGPVLETVVQAHPTQAGQAARKQAEQVECEIAVTHVTAEAPEQPSAYIRKNSVTYSNASGQENGNQSSIPKPKNHGRLNPIAARARSGK